MPRSRPWLAGRRQDNYSSFGEIPAFQGYNLSPMPGYSLDKPGVMVKASPAEATAPAPDLIVRSTPGQPANGPPQVPLEQVVRDYIDGRRAIYLEQGWQQFKAGKYRAACDLFRLADTTLADSPARALEVKFALLIGGFGAGQLALANNALVWLLTDDPRTGQIRDPDLLQRLEGMESYYDNRADFTEQFRATERAAMAANAGPEIQALRAVLLWGRKDRIGAIFHAKALADAGLPWSRLSQIMDAANRDFGQGVAPAASPVSVMLPAATEVK